jgi:Skp family chaperone for outer membrane proteins
MKRLLVLLGLLLVTMAPAQAQTAAATAPAASPKLPAAVIAVVDIQKILSESVAAKGVRDQLATRRDAYQRQVTADEQKLRDAEQALVKERATLKPEDFAKKRQAFEEQVKQVQQRVQERARILDTAFNKALGTIRQNLGQVVAEAAEAKGATVVLDKGQVVVVESSLDLTASVLETLNKKLPKVTVELPAN